MKKYLGIDYGSKRVGLALGNDQAKLASPLEVVLNDDNFYSRLADVVEGEEIDTVIVGLPRGLDGQETAQSWVIRQFGTDLEKELDIKVTYQDEAMTTQVAEKRLGKSRHSNRGQRDGRQDKQFVDADAAAIILQDYLDTL